MPSTEKCIDDEVHLFGGNLKQIERLKKTIGLDKRRVVDSKTTALDLCEVAVQRLLEGLNLTVDAVDALIFVTQTPDYPQPSNAAVLHGRLGMPTSVAALDVNLGCSGYVYGLWLAHMMASAGGCERVLLVAGDTLSRMVHPEDRTVAPVFGDGGSATLIEKSAVSSSAWFSLETDGKGSGALMVPAGGMRLPCDASTKVEATDSEGNKRTPEHLQMDGAEVFNFSISVEPKSVSELLEYAGREIDSVDYFVFHQANRYILSSIAKRLKLNPEAVPMGTVERYGNQSSASIPCAMCSELSEPLMSDSEQTVLLSGFGVGLSWASALVSIRELGICEVVQFEESGASTLLKD